MANGLYLGRQVDAKGKPGERTLLDPSDLLTHGLVVGMTGSGKTGLAVVLIEEVLRQGTGVIAIDPKGDLANLLLLFDDLAPASFEPWIDPETARRDGGPAKAAAEASERARKGLAEWGLGPADVAALRGSHDAVIFTPGSNAGVPLDVLQSLDAPAVPFDSAEEDLRDEIQSVVAGLLGLVRVDADPLQSPQAIFLATLVERAWRDGQGALARVADRPGRRAPVRQAGCPPARDGVPAEGPAGPHDGPQQPPRLAVVRELEEGRAARRGRDAAGEGRPAAAVGRVDRAPLRRGAAVRRRARARQGEDVDAPAARDERAAGARLHGRGVRLLSADREPAHEAADAHAAQAGPRAGGGRRPGDAEPRRPRLQGPRQHGHVDGRHAADAA